MLVAGRGPLYPALSVAMGEQANANEFIVKFRGVELRDETSTLSAAGVPDGGALIVLRRRRRAVR